MNKNEASEGTKPRYMTLDEVAAELHLSRTAIYPKIYAGELEAVPVHSSGKGLRVVRKSFEDYCARLEQNAKSRFGGAA